MTNRFYVPLIVALVLVLAALVGLNTAQAAIPAPLLAPTPVSVSPANPAAGEAVLFSSTVITQDIGSDRVTVKEFQRADVQFVTDQTIVAAAANTVTIKLQFSNDGINWTDGATLVSANAADAADLSQQAVFGKYARVYADVSNTNPLTVTVIGVLK